MSDPIEATRQAMSALPKSTNRPFVCLSYAQSLDGSIAAQPGKPTAISSSDSLSMTHQLRALHDCLLIGIGTALADNPRLNVRHAAGEDPTPVILDTHLRLPPDSRLLATHAHTHILCSQSFDDRRAASLENAHASIHPIQGNRQGLLDLKAVLNQLKTLNYRSVMVEGGARVIAHFLEQNLVDWLVITIAPIMLGGLRIPLTDTGPDDRLPARFEIAGTAMYGPDLVIWGKPTGEKE